jgi:rare lipoprotein A
MRIPLIIFVSLFLVQTGQAQRFRTVADRKPARPATLQVVAYPEHLAGRKMVGGGIYNPNGLTAAHASLAFGTMLELTARSTGRSVMVTVTDRGSGMDSSLIVSEAAMRRLGLLPDETGVVAVKVWDADTAPPAESEAPSRANPGSTDSAPAAVADQPEARQQPSKPSPTPPEPVRTAPSLPQAAKGGLFSVQLGSYSDKGTAKTVAAKLDHAWIQQATLEDRTVHRVFYGRYADRAEADAWQARLAKLGFPGYVRTLDQGK